MTTLINRSALIGLPAESLYNLVNDVESYPEFMHGCTGAKMIEEGNEYMVARLELRKKGIHYAFTTRNTLEPGRAIHMQLQSGPFRKLQGCWRFQPLGMNACKVTLELEFEPNNKLLGVAAASLFAGVANNLVAAITERAHAIYGV